MQCVTSLFKIYYEQRIQAIRISLIFHSIREMVQNNKKEDEM